LIHGGSESFYVVRCDAAILWAEQAQSGSIGFFQSFRLRGQVAVVDHERGEVRYLPGQVESITSAMHQPIAPSRSLLTLGCDLKNSKAA
jgi:hypothetical protein